MRFKKAFFITTLVLFVLLAAFTAFAPPLYYGLEVITEQQYRNAAAGRQLSTSRLSDQATLQGMPILYNASDDTYLVSMRSPDQSFASADGVRLYWLDASIANWEERVAQDDSFSLLMLTETTYAVYQVKFTTLPILLLEQSDTSCTMDRTAQAGTVTVIEPYREDSGRSQVSAYTCTVNLRGQTAYNVPKKSYEVDLKDENGQPLDVSLLGLREDDDWALNAAYSENSKIREPVLTQVWQQMLASEENPPVNGFAMQYCEVFFNGEYQGIYELTEPVDEKQEGMDKAEDRLYKMMEWRYPTYNELVLEADPGSYDSVSAIRLVNYKTASAANRWRPLAEYLNTFYYPATADETYAPTLEQVEQVADLDNLIDSSIFITLFQLTDHNPKNLYLLYRANTGKIYREMWDLNYSLGTGYRGELEFRCVDYIGVSEFCWDQETRLLLQGPDAAEFFAQYQARYTALRKEILSYENLRALIEEAYGTLERSGAFLRENAVWNVPELDPTDEYQYILDYLAAKLVQMDQAVADTAKELRLE